MTDPLINTSVLLGITDRLGVQKQTIAAAADAAGAVGTGLHFTRVSGTDIFTVERDLNKYANGVDIAMNGQNVVRSCGSISFFLSALAAHIQKAGYATFGAMLVSQSIRVSYQFAELWYWMRTEAFSASQVFIETVVTLGTIARSGGAWTFTAGATLGTGSGAYSSTNTAPQKAVLKVVNKGASDATAVLTVTLPNGTSVSSDSLTIPANSAANTKIPITVSSAQVEILAVTGAVTSGGSDGDNITILSVPQRAPVL